jgi:hypothetical protein
VIRRLLEAWHTIAYAGLATLIVGLLGAADWYGWSVFGESAEQEQPGQSVHSSPRFHK